jgi:hypothetical protein
MLNYLGETGTSQARRRANGTMGKGEMKVTQIRGACEGGVTRSWAPRFILAAEFDLPRKHHSSYVQECHDNVG